MGITQSSTVFAKDLLFPTKKKATSCCTAAEHGCKATAAADGALQRKVGSQFQRAAVNYLLFVRSLFYSETGPVPLTFMTSWCVIMESNMITVQCSLTQPTSHCRRTGWLQSRRLFLCVWISALNLTAVIYSSLLFFCLYLYMVKESPLRYTCVILLNV